MQSTIPDSTNGALIREYLDIAANDSENLERTMRLLTDDCVWVMEPTGDTYRGKQELEAFVRIAMSGRTHSGPYSIQITNWFTDGEQLCIEYTHGLVLSGVFLPGIKSEVKQGVLRYCITFHMRDGKFDRVHEFIQGTTFLANLMLPIGLKNLTRLIKRKSRGAKPNRPLGITIAGCLMVIFGLAEVVTGFTHNFFGISTSSAALFTYSGATLGICYAIAGAVILTMKRWAAILAIPLLSVDILGRIALSITGLYPMDSFKNSFAIIAGTLLAVFFAIYIGLKLNSFR